MKKIVYLLIFISFQFALGAQDTIRPYDPNYPQFWDTGFIQYMSYCDSNVMYSLLFEGYRDSTFASRNGLHADRYIVPSHVGQVMVTGVTLPVTPSAFNESVFRGVLLTFDSGDYLHPTIHMTNSTLTYQDTQGFDCYVHIPEASRCKEEQISYETYIGAHALYFDPPIFVADTFYLGFYVYRPKESWPGCYWGVNECLPVDFDYCIGRFGPTPYDDETRLPWYHANYSCYLSEDGEVERFFLTNTGMGFNWGWGYAAICPILSVPDTDSFGCPEVEGFGFAGMSAGSPTFVWDTAGEHELYQVAYGSYDASLESLRIAETSGRFLELFDNSLRPDIYYQARLRARCHHRCPIHDTVMWTAWSDPVYFYTGDHMPDTTHHTQPEGIAAPEEALPFAIVPNPSRAGTRQVVEIGQQVPLQGLTLTLHDAAGHEVLRMEVKKHRFALPVQGLPAGVYMATLASPIGTTVKKLVVEN